MNLRERWAAREVVVTRWHRQPGQKFAYGQLVADLRVDGKERPFIYSQMYGSDSECGIYWHLVPEGAEVGPSGRLLEYTDGGTGDGRLIFDAQRWPTIPSYRRRASYPRIFLSYRREDSNVYAGRLHETLVREFGASDVFVDEFSIQPGELWDWTIQQAAWHAKVMVCLIGENWAGPKNETAGTPLKVRRIDSEADFVHREIAAAFDTQTRVIPIILPGGALPTVAELPTDLLMLRDTQAWELTPRYWDAEMATIVGAVRNGLEDR